MTKINQFQNSPQQNSLDLCKRYFYARSSAEFYSG